MFNLSATKYLKPLLHIFFWGMLFLFFLWLFNFRQMYSGKFFDYSRLAIQLLLLAFIYYLNYYLLIPRYLFQKKFVHYAAWLVLVLGLVFGLSYINRPSLHRFVAKFPPQIGEPHNELKFFPPPEMLRPKGRPVFFSMDLILASISIAVGTSIRGTKEWLINEKQLKEIENQKLVAELSYLKAQINPHFFFNTLNGIYALALKKSDQTPEIILKLSDLMRYIIYEANVSKVLLKREISHIENYIDLQRIRLNEIVKVNFQVNGNPGILQIEPLLFSVFLENAFKHGIDYSKPGNIDIALSIEASQVIFLVENPIQAKKKGSGDTNRGVGLENIKQRLALVYPDQHKLKIYQRNERHIVELYLNVTNDEMYHN